MNSQTPEAPLIDPLDRDEHLSYAQAAKLWPNGPVSPHTVYRATVKGKRGVVLPTIPAGKTHVTTRDAIRWYFAQLQRKNQPLEPRSSRQQLDPALEAECQSAGI